MKIEELVPKLRGVLLEKYGLDIVEAKYFYSTQNIAFIFPGKPHMIRVSMIPKRSRAEILSELLWVDDLKQFKHTICEPNVSLAGNLLEEFEIDQVLYRASMFRTARGKVETAARMTPMFFICVGDLLGTIHNVSTNEREMGISFRRRSLAEQFKKSKKRVFPMLTPQERAHIEKIEEKASALPQDIGVYGLCHGDFHLNNFFVEANNVWVFDFDSCCYTQYLYDVACFVQSCFLFGYKAGEDSRKALYEDLLPYLKIGYELNKECGPHYWDDLELMIAYRNAYALMSLMRINDCGTMEAEKAREYFRYVLSFDDPLEGMTAIQRRSR